jgi:hypothetical protein
MKHISLIGAGGKMGSRITNNLLPSGYLVSYVEVSEQGIEKLAAKGVRTTPQEEAVSQADVVIMAIPDIHIGTVSKTIVPQMKKGAMMMLLDPAAAYANHLPKQEDVIYFITHPCHPPIFNDEVTPEAKGDLFGGVHAKQAIVCALMQGPDEAYELGESVARTMYAPVMRSHRITVEQMATLEPAMAETVAGTCAVVLREAMDEAVRQGVPYDAARDFMLGHIQIGLAIMFDVAGNPYSDAALVAIEYGKKHMLKENWKDVFKPKR